MEDKVDLFLSKLNAWAQKIGVPSINSFNQEDVDNICNCSYQEISDMNIDDLNNHYYNILKCVQSIQEVVNNLNISIEYCDSSINYIICDKMIKIDAIAKHEIKLMHFIKSDNFCKELFRIKMESKHKIDYLNGKLSHLNKVSNILEGLIKKKTYDRSN